MQHNVDHSRINLLRSMMMAHDHVDELPDAPFLLQKQKRAMVDKQEQRPHKARRSDDKHQDAKMPAKPRPSDSLQMNAMEKKDAIIELLRGENKSLREQLESSKEEMKQRTQEALQRNAQLQSLVKQYISRQNQALERERASLANRQSPVLAAMMSDDVILSVLSAELQRRRGSRQGNVTRGSESNIRHHRHRRPFQHDLSNDLMKQLASSLVRSKKSAGVLASSDDLPSQLSQSRSSFDTRQGIQSSDSTPSPSSLKAESILRTQLELQRLQKELDALKRKST